MTALTSFCLHLQTGACTMLCVSPEFCLEGSQGRGWICSLYAHRNDRHPPLPQALLKRLCLFQGLGHKRGSPSHYDWPYTSSQVGQGQHAIAPQIDLSKSRTRAQARFSDPQATFHLIREKYAAGTMTKNPVGGLPGQARSLAASALHIACMLITSHDLPALLSGSKPEDSTTIRSASPAAPASGSGPPPSRARGCLCCCSADRVPAAERGPQQQQH